MHPLDANVPSLIALPYIGFLPNTDPLYNNTRRMLLSLDGNPYFGEFSNTVCHLSISTFSSFRSCHTRHWWSTY